MKLKPILAAALALPALIQISSAATVQETFNDLNTASSLGNQGGGVGWSGNFNAVSGTIKVEAGDLAAPPSTNFSVFQGGATGAVVGDFSGARSLTRNFAAPLSGAVWFSFLVSAVDATSNGGIVLNPNPNFAVEPQSIFLRAGNDLEVNLSNNGGAATVADAFPDTGGDGIALDALVLGLVEHNVSGDDDRLRIWINPDVSLGEAGVLGTVAAYDTTTIGDSFGSAISALSVASWHGNAGARPPAGAIVDLITLSDDSPGAFVQVSITPDPQLVQGETDPGPPIISANLNFPATVASSGTTRTIRFVNNGPNEDIVINAANIINDASSVFTVTDLFDDFGDPALLPLTLLPLEKIDIEVTFDPAGLRGDFTADLELLTDENTPDNPQDKMLPVTATEFATGEKILAGNFNFESDPFNTGWVIDRTVAGGGIAPGSSQSAKLEPAGDGYLISSAFPGLSDFTVTYYFAVDDIPGAAIGNSNILFSVRGAPFTRMVTIAHFPAGVGGDSTPGWYVFDSTTWTLLAGLGTVAGSVDAGGDGSLDDPGDTKNVYQMTFTGRSFGDLFYEYDISVTGVGGAIGGGSVTGEFAFEALDPALNLPLTLAWEQRDNQLANAIAAGMTNQVGPWVDDVCVLAGTTPADRALIVAAEPGFGTLLNPAGPVTSQLVLRNEGSSDLSISDIVSSDAHFDLNPAPTFPIVIPSGGTASVDVEFDPGVDFGTFSGDLTLTSDDSISTTGIVPLNAASFSDGNKLISPNFDFEASPFDDQWINSGGVVSEIGLTAGSTTAAYVAGGETLSRAFVGTPDFEAQVFFAVDDSASRQLNFYLTNNAAGAADGAPTVNLRYEGGGWGVFDGGGWQALGQLNPIVGAANAANVYLLKIVGRGWGSPGATYDIFLSDVGGTTFTSAVTDLSFSQSGSPANGTPTAVRFRADTGGNPGFWVDDVCVTVGAPAVDDPNLSVVSAPAFPLQIDDNSAVTSDLLIANTGLNNTLTITAVDLAGPNVSNFTVLTGLPLMITPGNQAPISIQFERGADPAGAFSATATVTSNDETTTQFDVPLNAISLEDSGKVVNNFDFETQDGTPFAEWNEVRGTILAVNGLIAGSNTAARLDGAGATLLQDFTGLQNPGNFAAEAYFAILASTGRQFNMLIRADGNNGQLNVRYQAGIWYAFDSGWQTLINMNNAPLAPLDVSVDVGGDGNLDEVGDTKNVYRVRITGLGWGTPNPTYNFELFDEGGTLLAMANGLSFFQNNPATAGGGRQIEFSSQFGNGPGFWVDEACVTSLEALPMGDLLLTDVSASGDDITLNWTDIGGSGYSVERSFDGQNFTTIATGVAGTTFTDVGVRAANPLEDVAIYRVFIP